MIAKANIVREATGAMARARQPTISRAVARLSSTSMFEESSAGNTQSFACVFELLEIEAGQKKPLQDGPLANSFDGGESQKKGS